MIRLHFIKRRDAYRWILSTGKLFNQKGVALVTALIMSFAIMVMATGILFFINVSTNMSGAGKRYATAAEASDGAVDLIKDTINMTLWGEPPASGKFPDIPCLTNAITTEGSSCTTTITLPSALSGGGYTANITIKRLYSVTMPGGRIEFARSAGGASSTAIFFRVTTLVTGPDSASAENSVLYRFAG